MPMPNEFNSLSDLIRSLDPPHQSWADYLEHLPTSRPPVTADIIDRWDLRRHKCAAIHNRRDTSEHTPEQLLVSQKKGGVCMCGQRMVDVGPEGIGERRAYLGWLIGVMEIDERSAFYGMGLKVDALLLLAVVPTMAALMKDIQLLQEEVRSANALISAR